MTALLAGQMDEEAGWWTTNGTNEYMGGTRGTGVVFRADDVLKISVR